ncbi:unnamed protein product [Calicophoron daubneyi]|uniref:Uncharacterized protein n=1 Tax=Calicophoron daubneyi TaxID=300641 RepID=A0AAV2T0V1_CALDB
MPASFVIFLLFQGSWFGTYSVAVNESIPLPVVVISLEGSFTLHAPLDGVYNADSSANGSSPRFLPKTDQNAKQLKTEADVLDYCQTHYAPNNHTQFGRAVSIPTSIFFDNIKSSLRSLVNDSEVPRIRSYICLRKSPGVSSIYLNWSDWHESVHLDDRPADNQPLPHAPSLSDVHREYFADQFREILRITNSSVTDVVQRLISEANGLISVHQYDPHLALYLMAKMLQRAHLRLEAVWKNEEYNWSSIEQEKHKKLIQQLQAEDWASQNELAYALQEFNPSLERVENALSRLLSALHNSVLEEIRHLKTLQETYPWALHLKSDANGTDALEQRVESIENLHNVLLHYVQQATLGINALHALMAKQVYTHHVDPKKLEYKANLISHYDELQRSLSEAQASLIQAKQLALQMQTNGEQPISNSSNTNYSLANWIHEKHRMELAYIDLLVAHVLTPHFAPSADLTTSFDNRPTNLWIPRPRYFMGPNRTTATVNSTQAGNRFTEYFTFGFCLSVKLMLGLLFLIFCLLLLARTLRAIKREKRQMTAPSATYKVYPTSLFWPSTYKLKRKLRSRKASHQYVAGGYLSPPDLIDAKVCNPSTPAITTDRLLSSTGTKSSAGYSNPMYDA